MKSERLVLTPEHVEIRLQPAGLGSRFLAVSIDFFLAAAISTGLAMVFMRLPAAIGYPLWATASFLVMWGYHVYFEARHEGRSPGKRTLGLRVVDGRGLPLTVSQSFVRNVVRVLDSAPAFYGLGALFSLLDPHRRRLGDVAADTLVVAEGRSADPDPAARLSPEYNSLRTPRVLRLLRRRLTLQERELLAALVRRAPELDETAR
ncbi:MAG TPA: RDD family protein, partial [Vicinamibacteria bacterium]|nr:RDD family protein [Vicinamibacteria bacterium]